MKVALKWKMSTVGTHFFHLVTEVLKGTVATAHVPPLLKCWGRSSGFGERIAELDNTRGMAANY